MDVLEDRHYGHIAQKVQAKENSHMCHDECGFFLKGYLRPIMEQLKYVASTKMGQN